MRSLISFVPGLTTWLVIYAMQCSAKASVTAAPIPPEQNIERQIAQSGPNQFERSRSTKPNSSQQKRTNARRSHSTATLDIVIGGEKTGESPKVILSTSAGTAAKINQMREEYDKGIAASLQEASESSGPKAILARLKGLALSSLKEDMLGFAEAAEGIGNLESINPGGLSSPVIIEERIARYRRLRERNSAMLASLRTVEPTFTQELQDVGLPGPVIEQAVQAALQVLTLPVKVQYHEKCDVLCESAIAALQLFRKHWGHWVTDPNTNALGFKSAFPEDDRMALETALKKFQENFAQMNALEQQASREKQTK